MAMTVTVERAALMKATSRAQGVVERRQTIPILQNILIQTGDDAVTIRATDMDIETEEKIAATVEQEGAATIPAHTFHEIVRKLPDGAKVTLTSEDAGRMIVSAGRSKFSLSTLPREDFPMMASASFDTRFAVSAGVLRRLFDKTKFAISTEETRYYLNGVYFHIAEDGGAKTLRAVATDGHRLARVDTDLPQGAAEMAGVIVPRKTVAELRKLLDADDDEIEVQVSETKIRFEGGHVMLTSKVIDGSFPDYARVIPTGNSLKLEIDPERFASAVDRVSTVASERTRAVKLSLDADRLVLSVNSPETGSATEELEASYASDPLEIGFNSRFLLDIAGQIDGDSAVMLFSDPGSPTLVREADDASAIFVVMPLRV